MILTPSLLVILTLNPSPFVILSDAKNLILLRVNSARNLMVLRTGSVKGKNLAPSLTLTVIKGLKALLTYFSYIRNM